MNLGAHTELTLLVWAVILGLVQLVAATAAGGGGARDMAYMMGPRDEDRPVAGVIAGRLGRAFHNFVETFPLFAAAVIAADIAGKLGPLTLWGSWLYLGGRVVYLPLYAAGTPFLRTIAWMVAMVGIVLVIVAYFH